MQSCQVSFKRGPVQGNRFHVPDRIDSCRHIKYFDINRGEKLHSPHLFYKKRGEKIEENRSNCHL